MSARFRASEYHVRGDGARWFTEIIGKIERITPGGHITEYSLLTPDARPYITSGLDGAL